MTNTTETYYQGARGQLGPWVIKTANGRRAPLAPRLDLANHSPTGFEWGYEGSGPAQLALALLADALGDQVALEWYQRFKRDVVAQLPRDYWRLSAADIRRRHATTAAKVQAALAAGAAGATLYHLHRARRRELCHD